MVDSSTKKEKVENKQRQLRIYLDYVRNYGVLKLKWNIQKSYTTELKNIWQDMTVKLNDCGGPVRDATHWKKVFTEWKSHTRRKLKYNKPLNEIEKELVELTGLTSTPEKNNSEKILSDKSFSGPNEPKVNRENERNVSKNDVVIKDEILDDPGEASSSSFIEQEVIDRGSDEVHLKKRQKIVSQGKQDVNKKKIAAGENQSRDDGKQWKMNGEKRRDLGKNEKSHPKVNVSIQVGKEPPQQNPDGIDSGLKAISRALFSLSKAINRYCDIVAK